MVGSTELEKEAFMMTPSLLLFHRSSRWSGIGAGALKDGSRQTTRTPSSGSAPLTLLAQVYCGCQGDAGHVIVWINDASKLQLASAAVPYETGVVHTLGGFCALMGSIVMKPRVGRYDPSKRHLFVGGHNPPLYLLGTFLLWLGW